MKGSALIQLVMDTTGLNQKGVGEAVGVSQTQISKWKKGEYMSRDMYNRLSELAGIEELDPEFVTMAGSLEAARKWERIIRYLALSAFENAETGYDTEPLSEDNETLPMQTFDVLARMGVAIPERFPEALEVVLVDNEGSDDDRDYDAESRALDRHPVTSTIAAVYQAFNDVYGFHVAYVDGLSYHEGLEFDDSTDDEVRSCLLWLAAAKAHVDPDVAPKARDFSQEVKEDYERWLRRMKEKAYLAGIPLRAELMDLVYADADALGHEAEAKSLGFTGSAIHPDIYINELLVGMRVIHQVLPAILKKLGIDEEFTLDRSELRLGK